MKGNLVAKHAIRYTQIAAVTFTAVNDGTANWEDKDCSATVGTDTHKIWAVVCTVANQTIQTVGVRPHGSVTNTSLSGLTAAPTLFVSPDSAGHIDIKHVNGIDIYYTFVGYFE